MKTLEVKLEGGPFKILQPKENTVTEYDGIRIEEEHLGEAGSSANYRLTFKQDIANKAELSIAKRRISELIEQLREIFPFVGGNLRGFKEESNYEAIREEFLAEEGLTGVSQDITMHVAWGGTFETLPLDGAVKALHALDPKNGCLRTRKRHVWRAIKWFSMATEEQDPIMKFMKSFPPIDLLISSIKANDLSTKFEKFFTTRLSQESATISAQFEHLNKVRNLLFHAAQDDRIDYETAEETRRLLFQCTKAEIMNLISATVE